MIDFKEEYDEFCKLNPSDINEHLPTLYEYAKKCDHVTEMGVRGGNSSRAFLYANPKKYIAYDIELFDRVIELFDYSKSLGNDHTYLQKNVLEIEIEETDLLFIDTAHHYDQLKEELRLHAGKVRKYIAFHDTVTFSRVGEFGKKGIMFAIEEFLESNLDWKIVHDAKNNNGLLIIGKDQ
jgi:hypothetical protein